MVVGASIGVSLIMTNDPNPLNYFIPVDPPGASEATRWDATRGLFLTVEIATDDLWVPFVEQSVLDWNQSQGVILNSIRVPHDPTCSPSSGRLKVCNDDYGETPWHGINIILLDQLSNTTIHSVSKLNDRHNTDAARRTYIACHENGHGLGLPHTDEDHFNRDRGDCMDYTIRPQNNGVPGDFNLNLLEELYGTPDRPLESVTGTLGGGTVGSVAGSTGGSGNSGWPEIPDFTGNNIEQEYEEEDDDDDDRRHAMLRRRLDDDLDEADVEAFENKVSLECKQEYCVYKYRHRYLVKINQFLAPPKN
jgi:hypothetical protein